MTMKLHGITVQLEVKTKMGEDDFDCPVYTSSFVTVDNVLVGRANSEEQTKSLNLTGKRIEYWIGIPKGDTHDWRDKIIKLPAPFLCQVKTFGFVETAIQNLIPLSWGGRVASEMFE